eukprot:704041-Amphidinium_carterae.2
MGEAWESAQIVRNTAPRGRGGVRAERHMTIEAPMDIGTKVMPLLLLSRHRGAPDTQNLTTRPIRNVAAHGTMAMEEGTAAEEPTQGRVSHARQVLA